MTIRLDADWSIFDPARAGNIESGQIIKGLYDTLVELTPSGSVEPYLATSWKVSPGSITFAIRTDATCSDGTPVTSQVIVNSFTRLFSPSVNSPSLSGFGPKPWTATAVDATHVTIAVGSNSTALISYLGAPYAAIVCPAGLLPDADLAGKSYGSGPYTLQSAIHGNEVVLQKRAGWDWGPQGTNAESLPQKLDFKVISDDTTAANLVSTGGLDVSQVSGPDVSRLLANKSLNVINYQVLGSEVLVFNERPGHVVTDPAVREALSIAISPVSYAQAEGIASSAATNWGAPTWYCYDKSIATLVPQTANLTKAKSVLAADGYTVGSDGKLVKGGKDLTVILLADTGSGSGPDYIQAQWTQLGVNVTLHKLDRGSWVTQLLALNFDAVINRNTEATGPGADVASTLGQFFPNGPNVFGVNNTAAYQAFQAEQTALTDSDRCKEWRQTETQVFTNYDVRPLSINTVYYFTHGITFAPGPIDTLDLKTFKHV